MTAKNDVPVLVVAGDGQPRLALTLGEALFSVLNSAECFADGAAGAVGGCSAITLFYPLNIIRTKLQTDDPETRRSAVQVLRSILSKEGIGGLYKGWKAQIVCLGTSNFIYFYTYQMFKVVLGKMSRRRISALTNLAIGAVAGGVNVALTTPLWMVATQLALQAKGDGKPKL